MNQAFAAQACSYQSLKSILKRGGIGNLPSPPNRNARVRSMKISRRPLLRVPQPNACGGVRDTGALAHALPNGRLVANPEHRAQMEKLWNVPEGTISAKPGFDAVNLFRAMEQGSVKAALIMCTNPGTRLPSAGRYQSAMEKCFTVVADVVEDSETQRHAQVVLPAALWIEKEGVTGQGERLYQLTEKLLTPPGEARSDFASAERDVACSSA